MKKIKIASRQSPLALIQVNEIIDLLKTQGKIFEYETVPFSTKGDQDQQTSLTQNVGDDFFTDTLDQALLNGDVDLTIHSAKDLPKKLHSELKVVALTASLDESDAWVSKHDWDSLADGARVGTSSTLRQEQVRAIHPNAELIHIRGTIDERLAQLDTGEIDGLIVATCALKRLGYENRIKSILPWEGFPLQGQLAIVARKDDQKALELCECLDVRKNFGHVSLVGAGPGDPDLITVKGVAALQKADCVLYDYIADPALLKYAPEAEHVYVGKRKGDHYLKQPELCSLIRQKAYEGKRVVRLKGGDPFIFGRGAEEMQYLKDYHIPYEIIPGISAGIGLATAIGLPLTARGLSSSVSFVSGHGENELGKPKEIVIPRTGTIVFFMGLSKLKFIVKALKEKNWNLDADIMIISNGTRANQVIIKGTLKDIEVKAEESNLESPALVIAGPTVGLLDV